MVGRGHNRDVLRRAILEALDFPADVIETYDEDAGTLWFGRLRDEDLESLRGRVIVALGAAPDRSASR